MTDCVMRHKRTGRTGPRARAMRTIAAAVSASAALAPAATGAATLPPSSVRLGRISQRNGHFVDEFGRVRLFHGVNNVKKSEPFVSTFTDAELDRMATEWGYNLVRLGFSWEAYERERGVQDGGAAGGRDASCGNEREAACGRASSSGSRRVRARRRRHRRQRAAGRGRTDRGRGRVARRRDGGEAARGRGREYR